MRGEKNSENADAFQESEKESYLNSPNWRGSPDSMAARELAKVEDYNQDQEWRIQNKVRGENNSKIADAFQESALESYLNSPNWRGSPDSMAAREELAKVEDYNQHAEDAHTALALFLDSIDEKVAEEKATVENIVNAIDESSLTITGTTSTLNNLVKDSSSPELVEVVDTVIQNDTSLHHEENKLMRIEEVRLDVYLRQKILHVILTQMKNTNPSVVNQIITECFNNFKPSDYKSGQPVAGALALNLEQKYIDQFLTASPWRSDKQEMLRQLIPRTVYCKLSFNHAEDYQFQNLEYLMYLYAVNSFVTQNLSPHFMMLYSGGIKPISANTVIAQTYPPSRTAARSKTKEKTFQYLLLEAGQGQTLWQFMKTTLMPLAPVFKSNKDWCPIKTQMLLEDYKIDSDSRTNIQDYTANVRLFAKIILQSIYNIKIMSTRQFYHGDHHFGNIYLEKIPPQQNIVNYYAISPRDCFRIQESEYTPRLFDMEFAWCREFEQPEFWQDKSEKEKELFKICKATRNSEKTNNWINRKKGLGTDDMCSEVDIHKLFIWCVFFEKYLPPTLINFFKELVYKKPPNTTDELTRLNTDLLYRVETDKCWNNDFSTVTDLKPLKMTKGKGKSTNITTDTKQKWNHATIQGLIYDIDHIMNGMIDQFQQDSFWQSIHREINAAFQSQVKQADRDGVLVIPSDENPESIIEVYRDYQQQPFSSDINFGKYLFGANIYPD